MLTQECYVKLAAKLFIPDCEEEISPDQLIPLCLPLALFPGLFVRPAREEMLEDVAAGQHRVAGHVVHPPYKAFPSLGDEVFLKAAGGLLLRQMWHRDDRETLHQSSVQPVKVFVPVREEENGGCE